MLTTSNIRNIYSTIQKQLFYMIPEKWDKVYLYASVIEHFNNLQTGEMFFYYFPKSMLKKNPINVYEVPNKFNIDENEYLKLADKLYGELKKLRMELIKSGENPWTNITIIIKDYKFNVEYGYEDLLNSKYNSYDRHLIWRYKYLDVPLTSYNRQERKMIEEYLIQEKYKNKNVNTYTEGIYKKPVNNIIEYNKEQQYIEIKESNIVINDIQKQQDKTIKSQILNTNSN